MNTQSIDQYFNPEPPNREFRLGAYFQTSPPYSVDNPKITSGWNDDAVISEGNAWWECRLEVNNDGLTFRIVTDVLEPQDTPDSSWVECFSLEAFDTEELSVIAEALKDDRKEFTFNLLEFDTSEGSDGLVMTPHDSVDSGDFRHITYQPVGVQLAVPNFFRKFLAAALDRMSLMDWDTAIYVPNPFAVSPGGGCQCPDVVASPRSPEIQVCPDCGTRHESTPDQDP